MTYIHRIVARVEKQKYGQPYGLYVRTMAITTIQVSPATRDKLARLKSGSRETYDELINKLLALVPEGDEEGQYSHAFRVGLLNARLEIREGRVTPHEQVKRRLGL